MPENIENQVDYTEYLKQISDDVSFLREKVTQDSEMSPTYETQLQKVVALLTEIKESGQNGSSLGTEQLSTLTVSVQNMEKNVKNVLDVNEIILCGMGLIMGILCALIFSRFLRS